MRGGADLGGQEVDQPRPGAGGSLLQGEGEDRRHHLQPQVSPSSGGVINVRQTKYLQISHTYMLKLTPMHFSMASLHVDKHLIIGSKAMFDRLVQYTCTQVSCQKMKILKTHNNLTFLFAVDIYFIPLSSQTRKSN